MLSVFGIVAFTPMSFRLKTVGSSHSSKRADRRTSGAPRRTLLTFALTDTLLLFLTYVGSVRPSVARPKRLAASAAAAVLASRRAASSGAE